MTKQPFSTRPAYMQSLLGLHQLHKLIATDQDETPEAEAVRDRMNQPWHKLTEVEKKRIGGLSGDLYSISEPTEPVLEMTPEADQMLTRACEADEAGEWDMALELLRHCERFMEPAMLSYFRGAVWRNAGDHATATLFFEHAARLLNAHSTVNR